MRIDAGFTFDTGALVALERRKARMLAFLAAAAARRLLITVPTPVVVEWWRAPLSGRLIAGFALETLTPQIARIAGEALARVGKGPSATDRRPASPRLA